MVWPTLGSRTAKEHNGTSRVQLTAVDGRSTRRCDADHATRSKINGFGCSVAEIFEYSNNMRALQQLQNGVDVRHKRTKCMVRAF